MCASITLQQSQRYCTFIMGLFTTALHMETSKVILGVGGPVSSG